MSKKKGQALIETLVAVSVLTVGFLGVVGLLSQSLGSNRVVSDDYTATYLGAEGIEVVKNILDHNTITSNAGWRDGLKDGPYSLEYGDIKLTSPPIDSVLYFDPSTNFYNYNKTGEATHFTRIITISTGQIQDELVVSSKVSWVTRGGGSSEIDLEDHFFNWQNIPNN